MGEPEVEQFLSCLADEKQVAASTQNQALAALLFLYKVVLDMPLRERIDASRAERPERLPVVLTRDESSHGEPALRLGPAIDGMPADANLRCLSRPESHFGARW